MALLKNKAYQLIIEACGKAMHTNREFSFANILRRTKLSGLDIRWPVIREHIEDTTGDILLPVTMQWWTKRPPEPGKIETPEQAAQADIIWRVGSLALGKGKKAAGYVASTSEGGRLLVNHLNWKFRKANGSMKAANKELEVAKRLGLVDASSEVAPLAALPSPTTEQQ